MELREDALIGVTNLYKAARSSSLFDSATSNLHQYWAKGSDQEPEIPFTLPVLHDDLERTQSGAEVDKKGVRPGSVRLPSGSCVSVMRYNSVRCRSTSPYLGNLDPELYKSSDEGDLLEYPSDHLGRIWFTVEYDVTTEKLLVVVMKIRNLPSRDLTSPNACDPFVRLFLLPDERHYVQTKVRRKTVNPNFGEPLSFQAAKDKFGARVLKLAVFDIDPLQRYVPIGSVLYHLTDYARCKQTRVTTWRDLVQDDSLVPCERGEIHCSLCYNASLYRLTVVIVEAKDLKTAEEAKDLGVYCKVSFALGNKQVKSKKTRVLKRTLAPVFNESFKFNCPKDQLNIASLTIQVMQVKPERQIGRLVLGGVAYTREKVLEHWKEMLKKEKEFVQDWHYLIE